MTLADRVLCWIREEQLLCMGDTVLCAVSGGADSTALLCVLRELAPRLQLTILAAHVNHCLRGEESERDELFVRSLCARLSIPLFVSRIQVQELAKASGQGIEMTAREARYGYFQSLMEEHGIKVLATAHTAKDSLETALINFTRGTGVGGLAGIPPRRQMGAFFVVRPLLQETREELETYLAGIGEDYVTDSTNLSDLYTRNRIRRHVLPQLETINPSLYRTSVVTQKRLREDVDFIESAVDAAYRKLMQDAACDVSALCALHPAVSGRCIARIYRELAPEAPQLTSRHVESVLEAARSQNPSALAMLPGGVTVCREYDRLLFQREQPLVPKIKNRTLQIGEAAVFPEAGISISCYLEQKNHQNLRNIQKLYFDYSKICGILTVRARKSGDSIHLTGHQHQKTLKKAMIDAGIPRLIREAVPVICDDCGIIAVGGLGTAQHTSVSEDTQTLLVIEIKKIHGGYSRGDCIE